MLCRLSTTITLCFLIAVSAPALTQPLPQAEAFSAAVEKADIEQVRQLLEQEPRLALSRTSDGWPSFLQQAIFFSPDILNLFLQNGADPNIRNANGETLLHLTGDPTAIRLLLKAGADIDARDNKGWTPLMSHATDETTGPDAVYTLLAQGANPEAKGKQGETAALLLPEGGRFSTIKQALLQKARPTSHHQSDQTTHNP